MSQQQQQHQYPYQQSLPFAVNAEGQEAQPSYKELSDKAIKGCPESQRLLNLMQQEMQQPSL